MIQYDDLIGIPFVNHGRDVRTGLDCYGLVMEVYRRCGKKLPEFTADYDDCHKISAIIHNQARSTHWKSCHPPLTAPCIVAIRFGTPPGVINHTGVYIGDGKFIHTRNKIGVCVDRIDNPAWSRIIAGFYDYKELKV
jgi:cell wall-associated NlpC family hydrolase